MGADRSLTSETAPVAGRALPPPRSETGTLGWARANLFSSWLNALLTIVASVLAVAALGYGLKWVFVGADWGVISTVGGRFVIGSYNSDQVCPGNNCFWRPQASLLLITTLLGMAWGMAGLGVVRRIAVLVAVVAALCAFLPYSFERMGLDVRLLLAANMGTLGIGWAVGRHTPLGRPQWVGALSVAVFLLTVFLLLGIPDFAGLRPEAVLSRAVAALIVVGGIVLGLSVGAALAVGKHHRVSVRRQVRVAANLSTLGMVWAIRRYTPFGRPIWLLALCIVVLLMALLLLYGTPDVPGMQVVTPREWGGLQLNLLLAVAGIVLSLPIGAALALGRRSRLPVLKTMCVVFIEVFRGVPLITLLLMSQHLVPLAFPQTFPRDSVLNAGIVITLFSSAYMAENVRGGLQALNPGQAEAARALGLPSWQTTLLISLPQAIRNVIPAIVGQFIGLFKDTSLVYIIGMMDLVELGRITVTGRVEYQGSVREMFFFIAVVFWVFTYGMSYVSRQVEEHLGVGQR